MPRVVKDFTVAQKGIGRPDYFVPLKAEVGPVHQTPWYYTLVGILPPGRTVLSNLYQVPEDTKLMVGFLSAAFSQDAIYGVAFTVDDVERYPKYMSFSDAWNLGEAGWVLNAGEWMGGVFHNPLDVSVTVRAVPSGYLYDVD